MLAARFAQAGAQVRFHEFRWNTHLFAVLAAHLGLAVVGVAALWVHPAIAALVVSLAAISYLGDSTRRFYWLRRCFVYRPSRNLIATLPATAPLRRRIVFVGHSDATYTGWLFHPAVIRAGTKPPPIPGLGFMRQSMLVVVAGMLVSTAACLAVWLGAHVELPSPLARALPVVAALGVVPSLIGFVLNMQMVLNDTIVPGANDNLTGCTGAWIASERLGPEKPDDVELVFVCTGAEEAGTGGAYCLARDCDWGREETIVLAIDGLSNGELRLFIDGEIIECPPPASLLAACYAVRDADERFAGVEAFRIPSGASDAMPFLARRFSAIGIGCVDPDIGAPRHYHWPSDTPDNVEVEPFAASLDFVTALGRRLMISNPTVELAR